MASQGPLSAGGGTNDLSYGSTSWTLPDRIATSDGNVTTAIDSGTGSSSNYLVTSSHSFSIPAGATINGIVVEWQRRDRLSLGINDDRIRIVKGGAIGSTERSAGAAWPLAMQYDTFGSSGDLWGETWTYSDINSSGFGAALACALSSSASAWMDDCRITVYYTLTAADTMKFIANSQAVRRSNNY